MVAFEKHKTLCVRHTRGLPGEAREFASSARPGCVALCVAGDALFQTHENLEHLAMMEAVLGPLPEHMARAANRQAAKYFTPRCAKLMSSGMS